MSKASQPAVQPKAKVGVLSKMGDPDFRLWDSPTTSPDLRVLRRLPEDSQRASIYTPLSPPIPRRAITKAIRLTLGSHHLAELAPKRCYLLKLPPELITHIISFVITPKNNRLHLLYRRKPWIKTYPAAGGGTIRVRGIEETPPVYLPPVLYVNRQLNEIAGVVMRRNVVLNIEIGHPLAADVTLRLRSSLRPRVVVPRDDDDVNAADVKKENKKLAQERRQVKRLMATLASARGFQKVVVNLYHDSQHADTMADQLEGVLRHLAVGAISGRRWQFGGKNYVVVNMQDWMKLLRPHMFWNSRLGCAADVLKVLSKYRKIEGLGHRMILDVRLAAGFTAIKRGPHYVPEVKDGVQTWPDEKEQGYDGIVASCNGATLSKPWRKFLDDFEGRQILGGDMDWDVASDSQLKGVFKIE